MRADQIIIEPVLSEKTNIAREGETKRYTFKVRMDSKIPDQSCRQELFGLKLRLQRDDCEGQPKYSAVRVVAPW